MRIAPDGSKRRSGYVLIMTLVLIAISALSLAGFARRSLLLAMETVEAQEELQRRWGLASCRSLFLDYAEEHFAKVEAEHLQQDRTWPVPDQLYHELEFGKAKYRVRLSREDGKLNLNTLQARMAENTRALLSQLVGLELPLQLRPDTSSVAKQRKHWFSSWGQVFQLPVVWQGNTMDPLLRATEQLTCWGSGKLDIRYVSDDLLLLIVSEVVSTEIGEKLLAARRKSRNLTWKELQESLQLRRRDQLALNRWFTDKSNCYVLWVEMEESRRKWYYQYIQGDRSAGAAGTVTAFHW